MTTEEFAQGIKADVIDDLEAHYRKVFQETTLEEVTVPDYQSALELYNSLPPAHREAVFAIIRIVLVDTVSTVFSIIDGKTYFSGGEEDLRLVDSSGNHIDDLQDHFLELCE